jgi:hypothetical protein
VAGFEVCHFLYTFVEMSKTNYIEEAKVLIGFGVSVIPVKVDGSKLPAIKWKEFQTRLMTEKEIERHFFNCGGIIAITGNVSNLICIDFDLDKQGPEDDYWKAFMSQVPEEMKERMFINRTRSGGFHVWLRTDYEDKSRKVTHRALTMDELFERYHTLMENGANSRSATDLILKKPVECVIETRSRGSYGVFMHEQYTRFFGESISWFEKREVEMLLNIGYSLDYNFKKPKAYKGKEADYKLIVKFNEDCKSEHTAKMLEDSGLFTFFDIDPNGNHRMARVGSSNPFSAYVYGDTGVTHIFGLNPLTEDDRSTLSPFEVLCAVNDLDETEGLEVLKEKYG